MAKAPRAATLASQATGTQRLVTPALFLAWAAYLGGITLPVLHIEKFLLLENSYSILGGILGLLANGEILLSLILTIFSVVLPAWKLSVLHRLWRRADPETIAGDQRLTLLLQLGRWSMLDVQLVAIVVAVVKLGALVDAHAGAGIFFFGTSVMLTMVIGHIVERHARESHSIEITAREG